jgi:glycerophosphoryl diester phosphodiesterase
VNKVILEVAEKIADGYCSLIPRPKPLIQNVKNALLIAHRGAHYNSKGIFENTHKAFQLAQKAGCWGIEFDVHATADKVLIVNHDPTLKRLWKKNVAIADITFSALRELVPEVPTLAEVVAEYGKHMHLFIELKSPFEEHETLVEVLHGLIPSKDYHLMSLDAPVLRTLKQFPKHCLLPVAVHNNVKEFCNLSVKENYGGVMGHYALLTDKRIHQLKEAHQCFGVGFVNSRQSLSRELNRGLSWLFTNQAEMISQYLKHLNVVSCK